MARRVNWKAFFGGGLGYAPDQESGGKLARLPQQGLDADRYEIVEPATRQSEAKPRETYAQWHRRMYGLAPGESPRNAYQPTRGNAFETVTRENELSSETPKVGGIPKTFDEIVYRGSVKVPLYNPDGSYLMEQARDRQGNLLSYPDGSPYMVVKTKEIMRGYSPEEYNSHLGLYYSKPSVNIGAALQSRREADRRDAAQNAAQIAALPPEVGAASQLYGVTFSPNDLRDFGRYPRSVRDSAANDIAYEIMLREQRGAGR